MKSNGQPCPRPDIKRLLAKDVPLKKPQGIWNNRFVIGRVNFIIGPGGEGKTTLACRLIADATNGEMSDKPLMAAFLSQEEPNPETLRFKLTAADADMDRVLLQAEDENDLDFPRDIDKLTAYITNNGIQLLFMDSFETFISKFTNGETCVEVLKALGRVSSNTKCVITFIHHYKTKGNLRTFWEAISGSDTINRRAGVIWMFSKIEVHLFAPRTISETGEVDELDEEVEEDNRDLLESNRVLCCTKNNPGNGLFESLLYDREVIDIEIDGEFVPVDRAIPMGTIEAGYEAVFEARKHRAEVDVAVSTRGRAEQLILNFLASGPRLSTDVAQNAQLANVKPRTFDRARQKLMARGAIERYQEGRRWWMRLNNTSPDTVPVEWLPKTE